MKRNSGILSILILFCTSAFLGTALSWGASLVYAAPFEVNYCSAYCVSQFGNPAYVCSTTTYSCPSGTTMGVQGNPNYCGGNACCCGVPNTPTPIPAKPDLVVTAFSLSPNPLVNGQSATRTYTVRNQGNANSAGFWVNYYIGTSTIGQRALTPLASGQSISITEPGTVGPAAYGGVGTYTFSIRVDPPYSGAPNGQVLESNENNNTASFALTVVAPPPTPTRTPTPAGADTVRPTVTITNPTNGARVDRNETTTIRAQATDNQGVTRVKFFVNDTLKCTDTTSAYTCAWAVPSARNVTYTLRATAFDAAGNSKSHTIQVTSSR